MTMISPAATRTEIWRKIMRNPDEGMIESDALEGLKVGWRREVAEVEHVAKEESWTETRSQVGARQKKKRTLQPSPAGNSIKYLKRPELTVKNYKIIKFTREMKKNYCIWQRGEGTRAAGLISKWAASDWEILAPLAWREAGTHFPKPVPMKIPFLPGNFLSSDDRMKDAAKGLAGTRLGK